MSGSSHVGLATTLGPRRKPRQKRLKDIPFRSLASAYALTPIGETFYLQQTAGTGVYECVRTTTGHQFVTVQPFASRMRVGGTSTTRNTMTDAVAGALFDVWGSDAYKWDLRVIPNRVATADPTLNLTFDPFNPLDEVGATPARTPNTTDTTDNTGAGTNYAEKLVATAQAQELTMWRSAYGTIPSDTYRMRVDHKLLLNTATWRVGQNSASGQAFTATGTWATAEKVLTAFSGASDLGVSSQTGNADGQLAIQNLTFYDSIAGDSDSLPTPAQELAAQKAGHMKRVLSYAGAFSLTAYGSVNIDGANGSHTITMDPAGIAMTTGFTFGMWVEQTEVSSATNAMFIGFDNHASLTNGVNGGTQGQIGIYGSAGANSTGTAVRLGKLYAQPTASALASTPAPLHYIPNQGKVHLAMTMSPNGDGTTATQTLWTNGVPMILSTGAAWNTTLAPRVARMLIGAWNNTTERRKTANPAKGNGTGFYFYARALSDAEMKQRDRYMIEQLRLNGDSPGLRKLVMFMEGDSLTAFSPSWAWKMSDRTDFNPRLHMFNVAVGGTGLGAMSYTLTGPGGTAVDSARKIELKRRIAAAVETYNEVWIFVRLGTNEYNGATDPPHPWGNTGTGYAAWRTDYLNYIAEMKALSPKVKIAHMTMPPRIGLGAGVLSTEVSVELVRNTYNDDFRTNYLAYGIDKLIDLGLGTERMTGVGVFTAETIPGGRVMNNWRTANAAMSAPAVGSATRSPATTLTLSAASGSAITATAGAAGTFLYHDVGRKITAGALGYGVITAIDGTGTTATVDTTNLVSSTWTGEPAIVTTRDTVNRGGGFDATSYISGAWTIKNNAERWLTDGIHQTDYGGREECDYVASTIQAMQDALLGVVV